MASRDPNPSFVTASMPPASKKFLAKVARAVKSESLPRLARKIFGRAPVRARKRSDASRRRSNGSASRTRGIASVVSATVASFGAATGATSSTVGGVSARSGKSLVPVSVSLRRATACSRCARTAAILPWINPRSSAIQTPPAASISWNCSQAAAHSLLVMSSSAPEPATGSATLARFDSSSRMSCVLRAMRRAWRSGRPSAAVCGSTVMLSAPPSPAAATATVLRSMFTAGSRRVSMRQAVSAATWVGCGASPQASSMRDHNLRSARSLAMVMNWSASAVMRK